MKNILTSIFLLASSFSYAGYVFHVPLETQQGGSLPVNSITFNISGNETPTDPTDSPETPNYENTVGNFGTGGSSNSVIIAETAPANVDRTTVSYTLTTTHKLIFDSVSLEDVSGNGGDYSNATVTYQNCTGTGPYSCVIHISATEITGIMDPENGLGEINNSVGISFNITFNGRYETN